jgi:hypothetical protein
MFLEFIMFFFSAEVNAQLINNLFRRKIFINHDYFIMKSKESILKRRNHQIFVLN